MGQAQERGRPKAVGGMPVKKSLRRVPKVRIRDNWREDCGALVKFRWSLGWQHYREAQEVLAEMGGNWGR